MMMTAFTKRIEPSATGYGCYLDNQFVGTRATEATAREYLNELAYDAERGAPLPFEPVETNALQGYTKRPNQPISTLADGSTVYGQFDTDDTHCCICTDTASGWYISADSDGGAGLYHQALRIDLDLTQEKLHVLRTVLNSGAIEHMLACGRAWETDQPVPAAQPAYDHKRVEMLALIETYFAKR